MIKILLIHDITVGVVLCHQKENSMVSAIYQRCEPFIDLIDIFVRIVVVVPDYFIFS